MSCSRRSFRTTKYLVKRPRTRQTGSTRTFSRKRFFPIFSGVNSPSRIQQAGRRYQAHKTAASAASAPEPLLHCGTGFPMLYAPMMDVSAWTSNDLGRYIHIYGSPADCLVEVSPAPGGIYVCFQFDKSNQIKSNYYFTFM